MTFYLSDTEFLRLPSGLREKCRVRQKNRPIIESS